MFDMELVNIAIVILNYLNYWDTLACVKSIKSMHYSVAGIVIVDNGSPNESFDVLNEEYKDEECILVIKNKKNQGFARGNNLGINRARKSLKADFVLVINNDIIFTDECYFDELMNAYYPGVGVMGSSIINMKGMPQLNEPYYFGIRDLLFVVFSLITGSRRALVLCIIAYVAFSLSQAQNFVKRLKAYVWIAGIITAVFLLVTKIFIMCAVSVHGGKKIT